jgi:hypothetical protein
LVTPPEAKHTLYWYLQEGTDALLLCLDGAPYVMPPTPTWCEYLVALCNRLYYPPATTIKNVDMWRRHYDVEPHQLDLPMDAATWQGDFDFWSGPVARASRLLSGIHFGEGLSRYPRDGLPHMKFDAQWIGKDRSARWVTASDMLALSLLQARLIDLDLPIKVERWK